MISRRSFMGALSGLMAAGPLRRRATAASPMPDDFPSASDPQFWDKLRDQFLLRTDEVFFNSATLGSPPRVVIDRVTRSMRDLSATIAQWDYTAGHPVWFSGYYPERPLREKIAALIHARTDEVALTQNATMGMNFIANGLALRSGDEIVSTDQEHPGGRCGWELRAKRDGVKYIQVPLPLPPNDPGAIIRAVTAAFTPRTRVLAVAHITSALGIVMPVAALCREARRRGIFTVLDGAQAIGQIPVDVRALDCDAWFGSPHKWLLAPAGNGVLYVKNEHMPHVWTTLAGSTWDDHRDDGFRLSQRGTGNRSLLEGLDAAVDFHNRIGPARVYGRIKELGDYLRAELRKIRRVTIASAIHPELAAGMTTYGVEGMDGVEMQRELWERRRIRPRKQGPRGVRHSTHIYNSIAEIDATLELIREFARRA